MTRTVSYRWHLRQVMAQKNMFATTELGPLLAARGIVLSREQVYRLVTGTPERLNLATLAALCDILAVTPANLLEISAEPKRAVQSARATAPSPGGDLRPRRARIVRNQA